MASEEYAARVRAAKQAQAHQYQPQHPSALHQTRSRSSRPGSQSYAESPLRNASFPEETKAQGSQVYAVHDDETDDEKLHMKAPARKRDKFSGAGVEYPTADLGPRGGNTEELGGWVHEQGSGTPILASDEIAKNPGAEYLQPAVSPAQPIPESEYYSMDSDGGMAPLGASRSKSRSRPGSRPTSRPGSMHGHHGLGLSRFNTHEHDTGTPLEEIEEYEPLFTEDDDSKRGAAPEKLKKRLNLEKARFPSKDIWEDTPTSMQLQPTVETPEQSPLIKQGTPTDTTAATAFEHPDKEQARKGEVLESERLDFLSDEKKGFAKQKFGAHLQEEASHRPGLSQRFPSRDIWEDTPDSLNLSTTIGGASPSEARKVPAASTMTQIVAKENDKDATHLAGKPTVPARPNKAKPQSDVATAVQTARQDSGSSDPGFTRDDKFTSPIERQAPSIPERPKPQVPVRPARGSGTARTMDEPSSGLSKSTTQSSTGSNEDKDSALATSPPFSTTASKPKPAVPSRPHAGSSKIASLKAGFMNDLNSRLQLGPQGPKPAAAKEEEKAEPNEVEDKPIADARKGRARGPARRKPAVSPDPGAAATGVQSTAGGVGAQKLGIVQPTTLWHIPNDASAELHIGSVSRGTSNIAAAPSTSATTESVKSPITQSKATTSEAPAAESGNDLTKPVSHTQEAARQQLQSPELLPSSSNPDDLNSITSPTSSNQPLMSPTSPETPKAASLQQISSKEIGISPTTGQETSIDDPLASTLSHSSDAAAQTGEKIISTGLRDADADQKEAFTVFQGGKADPDKIEAGTEVVKE